MEYINHIIFGSLITLILLLIVALIVWLTSFKKQYSNNIDKIVLLLNATRAELEFLKNQVRDYHYEIDNDLVKKNEVQLEIKTSIIDVQSSIKNLNTVVREHDTKVAGMIIKHCKPARQSKITKG